MSVPAIFLRRSSSRSVPRLSPPKLIVGSLDGGSGGGVSEDPIFLVTDGGNLTGIGIDIGDDPVDVSVVEIGDVAEVDIGLFVGVGVGDG